MKVSCSSRKTAGVFCFSTSTKKYAMHQGINYLKTINCLNLLHVQTTNSISYSRCSTCVQFLHLSNSGLLKKCVLMILNIKDVLLGAMKYNLKTASWEILVNIKQWFWIREFVLKSLGEVFQKTATTNTSKRALTPNLRILFRWF